MRSFCRTRRPLCRPFVGAGPFAGRYRQQADHGHHPSSSPAAVHVQAPNLSLYLSGTPGTSAAIVRARRHMPLAIADAVGGGAHTTCTKVRQAHASSLMFRAPLPAVAHLQPPDLSLDLWHPDDFHHRKSPAARFVVIAGDGDVRVHQRLTNGCAQSAPAVRRCPR